MPPEIATVVFAVGILGLFILGRNQGSRPSPALWIPVLWVSLGTSKPVSTWLGLGTGLLSPDQILEGSPLERAILTSLLAAGLIVLAERARHTGALVRVNGPILIFLLYGAISIFWSDYPFVAFKRWTVYVGSVVMVLVVLTDPDRSAAIKGLLARPGFLLIPISLLLIEYYPHLGRYYNVSTGATYYIGVTNSKNELGWLCLIFGLGALWRFLGAFQTREHARVTRSLVAHGVVLAMALWLLYLADSAAAIGCFLIGGSLIVLTTWRAFTGMPMALHILLVGIVTLCLYGLILDVDVGLVQAAGRDATLTGRIELWGDLVRMSVDPLFGTGFESFWLGERLNSLWAKYSWTPNQAHNGYLEVFINLGWVGVALLGFVIARGYRNVLDSLGREPELGRLKVAFFIVAAIFNLTESAFRAMNPVWIAFLLAVMVIPDPEPREDGRSP